MLPAAHCCSGGSRVLCCCPKCDHTHYDNTSKLSDVSEAAQAEGLDAPSSCSLASCLFGVFSHLLLGQALFYAKMIKIATQNPSPDLRGLLERPIQLRGVHVTSSCWNDAASTCSVQLWDFLQEFYFKVCFIWGCVYSITLCLCVVSNCQVYTVSSPLLSVYM